MTIRIVIVADDLTGAADAAGAWAGAGLTVLVALPSPSFTSLDLPSADVLAVTTESRDLRETEAVESVVRLARRLLQSGEILAGRQGTECLRAEKGTECFTGTQAGQGTVWYKKIDSTLRGHPAAELAALLRVIGLRKALVAPAFPAQGRTTVNGIQRYQGKPLEWKVSGPEARFSDLSERFGSAGLEVRRLGLEVVRSGSLNLEKQFELVEAGLFLADAVTGEDLAVLARAAWQANEVLLCGSAGLASALAGLACWESETPAPKLPEEPGGPVLVVAGSASPITLSQVRYASARGACWRQWDCRPMFPEGSAAAEFAGASELLETGRSLILTPLIKADPAPRRPEFSGAGLLPKIARRLAERVAPLLDRGKVGRLVVTGGETARFLFECLGAKAVWLQGDLFPGIPQGRLLGGRAHGLPVVTKAGGFGKDATLDLILNSKAMD